jgi:hypothetical protein
MRVDSVRRGSPALRMGLEPGDVVISIDNMRFTTHKGYLWALRCASQRPSLIIHDMRGRGLLRRSCHLPHVPPPEEERHPNPPETYWMAIDLRSDFEE